MRGTHVCNISQVCTWFTLHVTSLSSNWTIALILASISNNQLHSTTPMKPTYLTPSSCNPGPILSLLAFQTFISISFPCLSFHFIASMFQNGWMRGTLVWITPKLILDSPYIYKSFFHLDHHIDTNLYLTHPTALQYSKKVNSFDTISMYS